MRSKLSSAADSLLRGRRPLASAASTDVACAASWVFERGRSPSPTTNQSDLQVPVSHTTGEALICHSLLPSWLLSLCSASTVCLLRAAFSPYACHCTRQATVSQGVKYITRLQT